eukprot:5333757-Pleurochrysis_carterae.AAC.1
MSRHTTRMRSADGPMRYARGAMGERLSPSPCTVLTSGNKIVSHTFLRRSLPDFAARRLCERR